MGNDEVKYLYAEFMGYLSQMPTAPQDKPYLHIDDDSVWKQYNDSVKKLSEITGKDYRTFLIEPLRGQTGEFIRINTYRHKLGGLISRLHAEYFPELPEPFSGQPSVVITQNQQQSQSVFIQMLHDVQSKIDEKLPTLKEDSKEKGFLQKLKGTLSSAPNIISLFVQILTLAKEYGISIDTLSELFK